MPLLSYTNARQILGWNIQTITPNSCFLLGFLFYRSFPPAEVTRTRSLKWILDTHWTRGPQTSVARSTRFTTRSFHWSRTFIAQNVRPIPIVSWACADLTRILLISIYNYRQNLKIFTSEYWNVIEGLIENTKLCNVNTTLYVVGIDGHDLPEGAL